MIAFCGIECDTCPVHLATLETDEQLRLTMRKDIIRKCAEIYGTQLAMEDVTDCDGCRSLSRRLFSGCHECKIRHCALGKQVENCAFCSQYGCELLQELFQYDPQARNRLEEIRRSHNME